MTRSKRGTIHKVLQYVKKYKLLITVSLLLAFVSVALTLYIPILIGRAVDLIVEGAVDFDGIARILITMLACVCVTAVAQWIMNTVNNRVTFQVVRDIREEAFDKITTLPLSYLDAHANGEIVSRVITDADTFADGLLMGFTQFFTGVMTILGTLVFMASMSIPMMLVVVLVTPLSLFVANFIAKKTYHMFRLQSETRAEQTAFIDEMIGNEKVVKAFGQEEETLQKFDEINERLRSCSLRAIFFSSITNPGTRFVNNVVYALVALIGAFLAIAQGMSVGALTSFLSYANQYTKPFNEISGVVTELQNALACAARIFELIEQPSQQPEGKNAKVLSRPKGCISCQDVSFSYSKDKKLIEQFNLSVQPGENIAIVGPTGCGKTTLINLLMRFYDTDAGTICIDGVNIKDITRHSLRTSYGMVLQETWLKSGTILDNILMGKPDATMEEVITAAKAAHSHSFIKRLPQGYNTVISEEQGLLSAGQKQLLCITRVMLCQPPMLILDEATSSIDTRTERKIQSAFAKLMEGRTSFIVAHRLSTIQNADLILVMKDGHIIEQGRHEELLAKKGFYSSLYESQFAVL